MAKQTNLALFGTTFEDGKHRPWYPSYDLLEKFKGLRTNVSTETRAKFWKKVKQLIEYQVKDEL